jgi:hypothetical protein
MDPSMAKFDMVLTRENGQWKISLEESTKRMFAKMMKMLRNYRPSAGGWTPRPPR